MKSLKPLPHDDSDLLGNICKRKGWSTNKDKWVQAYRLYTSSKGNPWNLSPTAFLPDIQDELYALYDSYRSRGHIEQIRNYPTEGSCPVCGSLATGTVDHFLPRKVFPEFSIYSLNLVPACASCNSSQKGATYRGKTQPARLIHPYFDTLGDKPILSVEIKAPFEAAQFIPTPASGLVGEEAEIVRFHLSTLLGESFVACVSNLFIKLPATIADEATTPPTSVTAAIAKTHIQRLLRYNQKTYGQNSWPAGFYRGILANEAAVIFVAERASTLLAQQTTPVVD